MPKFKCPKCDKTFAMAMHLGRHLTASHGQAPRKAAKPAGGRKGNSSSPAAAGQLGTLIEQLQAQRQEHVAAIEDIDAAFARFGITPTPRKRRGRPRRS